MGFPAGPVTLLFTDIEGGVGLWEADPEAMAEASGRHNRMVREQIEVAGGRVFTTVGEAFRAVFADPAAALASAVAIQRAAGAEPWPAGLPVRVRVALGSGACGERDGEYVGPVVNRAAGLLAAGHGSQVLVTGAVYELLAGRLRDGIGFRDLGEHRLQDLGRAERVFEVTGPGLAGGFGRLRSLDDPALRHNLPSQPTSFVGRAAELAELRSLLSGGSSCHLRDRFGDDSAVPALAGEAITIARGLADDGIAADALSELCWFKYEHGDLPAALAQIDEAVALARRAGDPRLIADLLGHRAVFADEDGDLDAALADQEEALALSRATGDNYRLAITLANFGVDELAAGDLRAARAHLQEANMLADNFGYPNLSAGLRENLGFVNLVDADPGNARRLFLESLDTARITGVKSSYSRGALLGLALAAGADGDPAVAATLHGVADEQAGRVFAGIEVGLRDRDQAQLRATLGDTAFEAAYRHGRSLSQTDGIALVVSTAVSTAGPDPGSGAVPAAGQATAGSSPACCRNKSGRSWRCWPAGRPTPRSPGGCSCRSTR